MAALTLLLIFLLFCTTADPTAAAPVKSQIISAVADGNGGFKIVNGIPKGVIVSANFTDMINSTGWSLLHIQDHRRNPNKVVFDEDVARLAGEMEAMLTAHLINMHWMNTMGDYCATQSDYCTKLQSFISNNSMWINQVSASYGYQTSLWMEQLEGLQDGYSKSGQPTLHLDNALLLLQINGDLDALEAALGATPTDIGSSKSHVLGSGSCSALVKLLPNYKELFVSHDTWEDYNSMLRIFKMYDFHFDIGGGSPGTMIPGGRQSFSSYPGVLLSGDDYYLLGSKMVTMETTIGNSNPDLWKFVTPNALFEGIRAVVANRLATSGKEWTDLFSMYNMGTYNNQWMIVDYKKFNISKNVSDGLLWVLEQLPGTITAADQTDFLRKQLYWPSFNIPFYKDIFYLSGTAKMATLYGEWFTWTGSPRAKIFARNHTDVTDISSMISLMRYNDFENDPLSKCNCKPPYSAENGISARSDLNPVNGTYPFGALGHRRHGGTDNKVTSFSMMNSTLESCVATSGPTFDQQPVFMWNTSGFTPIPKGHPNKWNFQPITIEWTL